MQQPLNLTSYHKNDYTFIVENLKSGNVDHTACTEAKIRAIKKFIISYIFWRKQLVLFYHTW